MNPSIKENPFLLFMQTKINDLFHNISVYSMDKQIKERIFITIDGVSGCGKTNFVYEYLKDFLFNEGITKKYQEKIEKIGIHDLSFARLNDRTAEEAILEYEINCKDGILIIDDFTEDEKNTKALVSLIKRIHANAEYKNTVVILMGEYSNNTEIIKKFRLEKLFNKRFRISFFTPSFRQIGDIFEIYAKKRNGFTLSEKAKSTLVFYFSKTKVIKDTKAKLFKEGQIRFTNNERNYVYTSEMFNIYKDILAFKAARDPNNRLIEQVDVFNSNSYKKLLNDARALEPYIVA